MRLVLVLLLFHVGTVTAVTSTEWSTVTHVAGRQRILSQKMTKEFLLAAKGIATDDNEATMHATVALFDASLSRLINGCAADDIPEPPTQDIMDKLMTILGLWTPFKELLNTAVAATTINNTDLAQIAADNLPLLTESNAAVGLYVAAAIAANATVPVSWWTLPAGSACLASVCPRKP